MKQSQKVKNGALVVADEKDAKWQEGAADDAEASGTDLKYGMTVCSGSTRSEMH